MKFIITHAQDAKVALARLSSGQTMTSALECFGKSGNYEDVCISLVAVTGVSLFLLAIAAIVLCCVCYKKKRRQRTGTYVAKCTKLS